MNTVTLTAPSYLANALINGNWEYLNPSEAEALRQWLEQEGVSSCLSCEDYGFTSWHDAKSHFPYAADCMEYTFVLEDEQ